MGVGGRKPLKTKRVSRKEALDEIKRLGALGSKVGRKAGRPPIPAAHRKSHQFNIRIRPGELQRLTRAARKLGVSVQDFVLNAALEKAA